MLNVVSIASMLFLKVRPVKFCPSLVDFACAEAMRELAKKLQHIVNNLIAIPRVICSILAQDCEQMLRWHCPVGIAGSAEYVGACPNAVRSIYIKVTSDTWA